MVLESCTCCAYRASTNVVPLTRQALEPVPHAGPASHTLVILCSHKAPKSSPSVRLQPRSCLGFVPAKKTNDAELYSLQKVGQGALTLKKLEKNVQQQPEWESGEKSVSGVGAEI